MLKKRKIELTDMNWEVKSSEKNPASRCVSLKHEIDIQRAMRCQADLFYRNPVAGNSSDSVDSGSRDSLTEELNRLQNDQLPSCTSDLSHSEIVEQLSKLKVGEEENRHSDVDTFDRRVGAHSILARNTPTDSIYHRTIHSLAESSCSSILAGGFNEKEDIEVVDGEPSLLNIAINESDESNSNGTVVRSDGSEENDPDQSQDVESFRYMDSLELQREKRSVAVEKDSLDSESRYGDNNMTEDTWMKNAERENPVSRSDGTNKRKSSDKPIVISNETVAFDIKVLRAPDNKHLLVFNKEKKDKNDNIRQDLNGSDSRGEMKYMSLINESEQGVTASLKTPNLAAIRFIEDCSKSTPVIGVMADTFGSDFLSDITNLSMLGENVNTNGEKNTLEKGETSCCRDNILRKFSQQFAEAPTEFTAKLITVLEESILHSKPSNTNTSDISLSRVTEEFRKICREYGKRIEDESMPDFGSFQVSSLLADESCKKTGGEGQAESLSMHNFTNLGGGKKVYRKTPRRILKTCSSPKCANIFHRVEKAGSDSTRYFEASGNLDNTETFEFWENLCYEMSPTKQSNFQPPCVNISEVVSHEDLIRKSDRQMAALDQSNGTPSKLVEKGALISGEKNSPGTWRDFRNSSVSAFLAAGYNNSNKNLEEFNGKETHDEIERILAARLVEKRRKCFEEASRVVRSKEKAEALETSEKNKSSNDFNCETIFLSTLSACVDYFDVVKSLKDHRHSLQCIPECSEESTTSEMENTTHGKSLKCVEAVIMPVRNSAKYRNQDFELSKPEHDKSKMIAEAYLDLSETSGIPEVCDGQLESLDKNSQRSPNCRFSPSGACMPSVVSKKIKRSVSPIARRSLKGLRPATYSSASQSPARTLKVEKRSEKKREIVTEAKSSPRFQSKTKSTADSPGLMDVTNIQKSFQVPKVVIMKATPPTCESNKKSSRSKIVDENTDVDCKRELNYSETETPEQRMKRYFYSPGKTPAFSKVKPKRKYFETPRRTPGENKLPVNSPSTPGSHRFNYNTVLSPVGMYIRGTNPNLITNVRGKTNERMLTPRAKTPQSKSKAVSPILARSPRLSPQQTETSRLKFKLSTPKKQVKNQAPDILNVAVCESDPSSNRVKESMSTSPFPKIFYKPAPCVKMVNDSSPQRLGGGVKSLAKAFQEKIVYRHEGRVNSARQILEDRNPRDDESTKNSLTSVSGDISLWHKKPAAKTNYLCKK